jgi:spoIIIJ-associated protein
MEPYESEGKTLEEAIEKLCNEMNVKEEDLDIEVISNSNSTWRFLGIGSSRNVKIRATFKQHEEQSRTTSAKNILTDILGYIYKNEFGVEIQEESQEEIKLNITGGNCGLVIGKNGEVLDALQYIVNKIENRSNDSKKKIIIDSEDYRSRKIERLTRLANQSGEKARKTQKPVTLHPMNAHDRRIIHLSLQNDGFLTTKSLGNGFLKKVVIIPKKEKEAS